MILNSGLNLGIADSILSEPEGGTHLDYDESAIILKESILNNMKEISNIDSKIRISNRIEKYEKMGRWTDG